LEHPQDYIGGRFEHFCAVEDKPARPCRHTPEWIRSLAGRFNSSFCLINPAEDPPVLHIDAKGLSYSQVLNLIIWQNTISNYFLTSAGIVTYITMTRMEHEIKISRSVTIFLLTKAGDLTAIWVMLLVSTVFLWSRLGVLQALAVILILAIGLAVLAFFLTILLRRRFVVFLGTFF
jgi:hypothetical protein